MTEVATRRASIGRAQQRGRRQARGYTAASRESGIDSSSAHQVDDGRTAAAGAERAQHGACLVFVICLKTLEGIYLAIFLLPARQQNWPWLGA